MKDCADILTAAEFINLLVGDNRYDIGATETIALATQIGGGAQANPFGFGGVLDHNTHFTGALIEYNTPETVRKFRRTNENWRGQIGVVFDDIGETKTIRRKDGTTYQVTIKAPPVQPTFIVETKPGSEQWGYAFNQVVRDPSLIESITRSAIAAEMCDSKGAGGRIRLSRLPNSRPEGKTHTARLKWADWSRRLTQTY